jgi:hypothetical protein
MKKLYLTSALVGSVIVAGAASAETKVSGNMTLSWKSVTEAALINNTQGFGRETQINVSNSGDLNNGMGYASGFSLEFDGNSEGSSTSNENIYFDVKSGNTTFGVGMDHFKNTSQSAAPRVAEHADTTFGGITTANAYDYHAGNGMKESFGFGLTQKLDSGAIYFNYVPRGGDTGGNDESAGSSSAQQGKAYSLIYNGNAGVDGLNLVLAYQNENSAGATNEDTKTKQYGASYNFGGISAGVQFNNIDNLGYVQNDNVKSREIGVTAALGDNASIGVLHVNTDIEDGGTKATSDENMQVIQLGYNLGPAAISVSFGTLENGYNLGDGTQATKDVDVATVRLSTKF